MPKQLNERYARYRQIIVEQGITSIEQIADMTKQRALVVKNDLLRMIYLGMLKDVYVDENTMQIFFQYPRGWASSNDSITVNINMDMSQMQAAAGVPVAEAKVKMPLTVECPGCGSKTVLQPGETKSCGYCDSPLTYPANS